MLQEQLTVFRAIPYNRQEGKYGPQRRVSTITLKGEDSLVVINKYGGESQEQPVGRVITVPTSRAFRRLAVLFGTVKSQDRGVEQKRDFCGSITAEGNLSLTGNFPDKTSRGPVEVGLSPVTIRLQNTTEEV